MSENPSETDAVPLLPEQLLRELIAITIQYYG